MSLTESLPEYGPLTKSESLEDQLEQAKLKIAALERTTSDLKRENELLKYEVFRFRNVFVPIQTSSCT